MTDANNFFNNAGVTAMSAAAVRKIPTVLLDKFVPMEYALLVELPNVPKEKARHTRGALAAKNITPKRETVLPDMFFRKNLWGARR